ncbi:SDR family oxidoreductase [Baekduia soli]|uniref:SDR family oxidoreductase n=1 Tax=Baekduia soli TaxID=496014 RepID=A0A5B8U0I5_9ACTN|nr:SDR family oxidoreductase [Baekduia soli]QEC46375.1 SDR family oxidoreductase [Baekduia soli]
MPDRVAFVSNVRQFAGPGTSAALLADGFLVVCHDRAFADPERRAHFAAQHPDLDVLADQEPDAAVASAIAKHGRLDVVVTNDLIFSSMYGEPPEPAEPGEAVFRPTALEDASVEEFRATLEALTVRPFAVCRAALPTLKAQGGGIIIFITAGMHNRANPQLQMGSAARTAATNLAQSLAVDAGPRGVQVFAIGPAWFQNPTYFPDVHREQFMPIVERDVPLRRLGTQEEMGALVSFLASGRAAPLTGSFLPFVGGLMVGT